MNNKSVSRSRKKKSVCVCYNKRECTKIGRLTPAIAKRIGVETGDIVIDSHTIAHITNRHQYQLDILGINAKTYAEIIARDFNQVYEGTNNRLLLVFLEEGKTHHNAAVVDLLMNRGENGKCFWKVVTASPRNTEFFYKKTLLYKKR